MTNSVAFCKDTFYKCGANIDHCILVVGYGIESGLFSEKYWILLGVILDILNWRAVKNIIGSLRNITSSKLSYFIDDSVDIKNRDNIIWNGNG